MIAQLPESLMFFIRAYKWDSLPKKKQNSKKAKQKQ